MKKLTLLCIATLTGISAWYLSISETHYNAGVSKAKMKNYRESIIDYNLAIENEPDNADAYIQRGNARYELAEFVKALEDYTKAIELNPSSAEAYYRRGNTKAKIQDYKGAVDDYNK